ncbi:peptide ABC transporter permease [Clostridia bacterium]|nr:peptide ABC transporter permease [Clostridia bacterium]
MKLRYVLTRIFYALIILFVVISLNFLLPRLIFTDPAEPLLRGIPEDDLILRAAVRAEYGLDGSLFRQYFVYLGKMFTFDYGRSYVYKAPVFSVMFSKIPWSMILSLSAMLISVITGIHVGARAAKHRGKRPDKVLLGAATLTTALPSFWIALVFMMLLCFAVPVFPFRGAMTEGYSLTFHEWIFWIGVLLGVVAAGVSYYFTKKVFLLFVVPVGAFVLSALIAVPPADLADIAYHSILPIFVLCIGSIVSYALMVRNSMIAAVNEDYVTTARAKGLSERQVLFGHTLRNALLPMVTSIGMSMAGVFGGSVLIEKIFAWPGMGGLLLEAQNVGDFQLAQGIMFFYSFVTIVCNLLTDFVYHRLDPRVKLA